MKERPYSPEMLALAEKWINGTITPAEAQQLHEWYDTFDDTELAVEIDQATALSRMKPTMLKDIQKQIKSVSKIRRIRRLSAAAAILLLLATGAYLALRPPNTKPLANTTIPPKNTNDIPPGTNKATLTLADGSTVTLDSAGTGFLSNQGNSQVTKSQNGQIQYAAANNNAAPEKNIVYNTLSTPRGGQYRLKLQDGTNVWLNAGSSIRYPTAFQGKERKVEITGEAYFQVAKNADMPFKVAIADQAQEKTTEIEVLGTEFNVNAYKDETAQKTTLIDGSVKVAYNTTAVTLKPSQQAIVNNGKDIRTALIENTEQIVAWKNGAFAFDDTDMPTILRQISRWYDVDVEYEGKAPADHFTGTFPRSTSLAGVLRILNASGVKLVAENKKIVIRS